MFLHSHFDDQEQSFVSAPRRMFQATPTSVISLKGI